MFVTRPVSSWYCNATSRIASRAASVPSIATVPPLPPPVIAVSPVTRWGAGFDGGGGGVEGVGVGVGVTVGVGVGVADDVGDAVGVGWGGPGVSTQAVRDALTRIAASTCETWIFMRRSSGRGRARHRGEGPCGSSPPGARLARRAALRVVRVLLLPGEEGAQFAAGLFDRVGGALGPQLQEFGGAGILIGDEALGEGA